MEMWYLKTVTLHFRVGTPGLIKKKTPNEINIILGVRYLQEISEIVLTSYISSDERCSFNIILLLTFSIETKQK